MGSPFFCTHSASSRMTPVNMRENSPDLSVFSGHSPADTSIFTDRNPGTCVAVSFAEHVSMTRPSSLEVPLR